MLTAAALLNPPLRRHLSGVVLTCRMTTGFLAAHAVRQGHGIAARRVVLTCQSRRADSPKGGKWPHHSHASGRFIDASAPAKSASRGSLPLKPSSGEKSSSPVNSASMAASKYAAHGDGVRGRLWDRMLWTEVYRAVYLCPSSVSGAHVRSCLGAIVGRKQVDSILKSLRSSTHSSKSSRERIGNYPLAKDERSKAGAQPLTCGKPRHAPASASLKKPPLAPPMSVLLLLLLLLLLTVSDRARIVAALAFATAAAVGCCGLPCAVAWPVGWRCVGNAAPLSMRGSTQAMCRIGAQAIACGQ